MSYDRQLTDLEAETQHYKKSPNNVGNVLLLLF